MTVILCLLALVQADGDRVASPPGTILPNRDELVATFRRRLAEYDQPLDHFVRRVLRDDHNPSGPVELTVHAHGEYYRSLTVVKNSGVQRAEVRTSTEWFGVIKVPPDPKWKLMYQERRRPEADTLAQIRAFSLTRSYLEGGYSLAHAPLDGPGWTVTQVTAERVEGKAVYRFHYMPEKTGRGYAVQDPGYWDVDPANWLIVRNGARLDGRSDLIDETELTYNGTVHGMPALKRLKTTRWITEENGQRRKIPFRTIDVLEFREEPTFSPSEYSLSYYGLGPPYRAILGVAATGALGAGWVYAWGQWRRKRRRRTLTWAVTAEAESALIR